MFLQLFPQVVDKFWIANRRKTCVLLFLCQGAFIGLILVIGYVYVHTFVPLYNAKRLSKSHFVCSPVEDKVVSNCEIPSEKTLDDLDKNSGLFYENGHSYKVLDANGSIVGVRNFQWSSCGEFCTPEGVETSGGCRQVRVKVRAPGSDLRIEGCTNYDVLECGYRLYAGNDFGSDEVDDEHKKTTGFVRQELTTGILMGGLGGIFECIRPALPQRSHPISKTGRPICSDASKKWTCPEDLQQLESSLNPIENCSQVGGSETSAGGSGSQSCFSQPGLYICKTNMTCSFISHPLGHPCTRKCESVPLLDKNVIITNHHGRVITTNCWKAFHTHKGFEVWPRGIKSQVSGTLTPPLFLNCNIIKTTHKTSSHTSSSPAETSSASPDIIRLDLGDCVNGSLLENQTFPASTMTFKSLESLWFKNLEEEDFLLDPINQRHAPPESLLGLFSSVPLYLEDFYDSSWTKNACDTSPDDSSCSSFYSNYGLGSDSISLLGHNLRPIFPCYCRNTFRSTYCIVNGTQLFKENWEDYLVSRFIAPYAIHILSFVSTVAGLVLIFLCILMWPVFQDKVIGTKQVPTKSLKHGRPEGGHQKSHISPGNLLQNPTRRPSYSYSIRSTGSNLSGGEGTTSTTGRRPSIFIINSETPVSILEIEAEVSGSPNHLQKPKIFHKRDDNKGTYHQY